MPPSTPKTIDDGRALVVEGLSDLIRAFRVADRVLSRDLRKGLRDAAEPVRGDAEQRASVNISRIGRRWPRMRVGVTQRSVYVAPRERGIKGRGFDRLRRPNLAGLLATEMEAALDENLPEVEQRVGVVLDTVGRAWERA